MNSTGTKSKSQELFEEALKVLPGGISRNAIDRRPHPDYAAFGKGCHVTDIDGVTRTDFANNMASLIHGHAHPQLVEAVSEQIARGTAFTMATEQELRLAWLLCERNDGFEKIRFMNSGTEAVMAGIKAARAFTGRPKIAKSEGAYHGIYDYAEVSQKSSPENWGSGSSPNSVPVVDGTPQSALNDVVVIPFNDLERTIAILDRYASELACVLIDPLPHRAGLSPATSDYMQGLRQWSTDNGALLFMDEVITFRMGYGGAQDWYPVQPDLTALGKIIGGGFPVGALAGKNEYMAVFDSTRKHIPFPHSGTFSANPVTMTAGRVAMELFDRKSVDRLNRLGEYARQKVSEAISATGIQACVTGAGSMFRVHLKPVAPFDYRSAYQDSAEMKRVTFLVDYLYDRGIMLINSCSAALSTVMTESEVDQMAETLVAGFQALQQRDLASLS